MLNKEYYRDLLVEFAISNDKVALNAEGVPIACNDTCCAKCGFNDINVDCDEMRKRWANKEYTEPRIHWEDVPVDTPVYICTKNGNPRIPRHFAEYDAESDIIKVFDCGRTSFTITNQQDKEMDMIKHLASDITLAREEDKKKYYHR